MQKENKEVAKKAKIVYPELTEEDKSLYSNAINVNHTPWDFALHFACVTAPIKPSPPTSGEIEIGAKQVAVITIPVTLMKGFIKALQTNVERYEKAYGKIDIPREEQEK